MSDTIYLDNQATTQIDPEVIDAMMPYFYNKFGNASSIHHSYGRESKKAVERSRQILADSIKAKKREIVFTSGATEAINLAIKGVAGTFKKKHHMITQATEHSAVLDTLRSIEKKGWDISILPVNRNGLVDPQDIANAITDETSLVSIMHANNEIGTIQPVKQIGEICKKNNILFFVDASQSFGKLEIDVKEMKIDLLASTAHKLYGPKGIGLLYISQKDPKVTLEMQMDGGGHEKGYRSGTLPVPLIVGFAKAMEICENRRKFEYHNLGKLRNFLFKGIQIEHPDVILNGSFDSRLSHNLNLCFPKLEAETIIMKMKEIACSTGSACSSAFLEPSHVIKALGHANEIANSSIRFSLGRFNTQGEIEKATLIINNVITNLKLNQKKRKRPNSF